MGSGRISCSACGHENRPTASYCGRCAAALTRPAVCPACGVANPFGQSFCDACGKPLAAPTPSDLPTSIAAGRYQIRRLLGEGSKKRVYLAHDSVMNAQVAIKLPHFSGTGGEPLERFYREARVMFGLRHPGICPVHDVGEIDGQHYLVMAFIQGVTLSRVLLLLREQFLARGEPLLASRDSRPAGGRFLGRHGRLLDRVSARAIKRPLESGARRRSPAP